MGRSRPIVARSNGWILLASNRQLIRLNLTRPLVVQAKYHMNNSMEYYIRIHPLIKTSMIDQLRIAHVRNGYRRFRSGIGD